VPSPSPSSSKMTLHIAHAVDLRSPNGVESLAFGAGVVWIAVPGTGGGAGALMRVNASDGTRYESWSIGGDPVGVAVGERYVWVAIGPGDPAVRTAVRNTVSQFDKSTGALIQQYPVSAPRAIAVFGDAALVGAGGVGNVPTTLLQLQNGKVRTMANVPGLLASNPGFSGPSLVVCGSSVYLATSVDMGGLTIFVDQLAGGAPSKVASVSASGIGSLACSDRSLYLAVKSPGQGAVFPLSLEKSVVGQPFGPSDISDLATVSGRLWGIGQGFEGGAAGFVHVFDPANGSPLASIELPPGDCRLLAADSNGVWLVAGSQLLEVVGR
jgi:hypothetical protein